MSADRALLVVTLVAAAVGCGDEPTELTSQYVTLGPLGFEVPADWQRVDHTFTSVWTPTGPNPRKESVTVMRVDRAAQKASAAPIERLLAAAQGSLRDARISASEPITTARGLTGAQLAVTFTPLELPTRYRRSHAALIDGSAIVHVYYTAATPDASLAAFNLVLETIRHEEGS